MAPFKSTHVFSDRLNTAHQFPSVQAMVTHISLTVMCFRRQVGNGCKHVLQRCFSLKQTSSHYCLYFVYGCGQRFHSAACSIVVHEAWGMPWARRGKQLFGHFRDCIPTWYHIHLSAQMQVSGPWGFIFLSCIYCCAFIPNLICLYNFSNFLSYLLLLLFVCRVAGGSEDNFGSQFSSSTVGT